MPQQFCSCEATDNYYKGYGELKERFACNIQISNPILFQLAQNFSKTCILKLRTFVEQF